MMKKVAVGVVVVGLAWMMASPANAANITVTWEALAALLANANGTAASQGDLLQIGSFTSDFDIAANQFNLSSLQANFTPFASGVVGSNTFVDGAWSIASTADEGALGGSKLYLWVFNATTAAGASEQGIFSSTLGTVASDAWSFPHSTDAPNSTSISLSQIDQIVVGAAGPGITIPDLGTLPSFEMVANAPAAVPEPTSLVLVMVGLLPALRLRRRRSS